MLEQVAIRAQNVASVAIITSDIVTLTISSLCSAITESFSTTVFNRSCTACDSNAVTSLLGSSKSWRAPKIKRFIIIDAGNSFLLFNEHDYNCTH